MTSRRVTPGWRWLMAASHPPASTAASWPGSPTATTLAPARSASASRSAERRVRGHAGLVDHQHRSLVKATGGRQLRKQRVHRLRFDAGRVSQLPGGPAGGSRADHVPPGLFVGAGEGAEHRRLAGPGQSRDRIEPAAAGGDRSNRGRLIGGGAGRVRLHGSVHQRAREDAGLFVGAAGGAVDDLALAGDQLAGCVPRLPVRPHLQRHHGVVSEVVTRGCVELGPVRALRERASDLGQGVTTRKRVMPGGQTSGPESRRVSAARSVAGAWTGRRSRRASSLAWPSPCSATRACASSRQVDPSMP